MKTKYKFLTAILVILIFTSGSFIYTYSKLKAPNLEEAYRREFKGENTVIAIIDTGADINHSDFLLSDNDDVKLSREMVEKTINEKGLKGKYISPKIPYIHDYYNEDNDIFSKDEHGMHVAGIAAGNGKFKGVAPNAQLLLMKVFPDEGLNENLDNSSYYVKAISDAIELGADVINLSLGTGAGTENFVEDNVKEIIQKAKNQGIIVNVAAGNNAYFGFGDTLPKASNPDYGVIAMPSNLKEVISVGSTEGENISEAVIFSNNNYYPYKLAYTDNLSISNPLIYGAWHEFVDVSYGSEEDYNNKQLDGKIAIAMRGKVSFRNLQNIARLHGASAIIVYNSQNDKDELMTIDGSEFSIPMVHMKYQDAKALINGNNELVFLKDSIDMPNKDYGKTSIFSPLGLTNEGILKPDILAPGGNILSLDNNDSYKRMSGTSMAAPFISGVSALIKQRLLEAYPDKADAFTIGNLVKRILISTASPIKKDDIYVSPRRQGNGLVNIKEAITAKVIAYANEDNVNINIGNVNDTLSLNLTLENISNKKITLKGTYSLLCDNTEDGHFTLSSKIVKEGNTNEIVLNPKEKKNISYDIDISDMNFLDKMKNGYYIDGFLQYTYNDDEHVGIAFTSFKGDYDNLQILEKPIYDTTEGLPTYYKKSSYSNDFTHLGSSIYKNDEEKHVVLGETPNSVIGNRKFDSNHLAFSPNNDKNMDQLDFVFTVLRSFEKLDISIYDINKKLIKNYNESKKPEFLKSYYGKDERNPKAIIYYSYTPENNIKDGKYEAIISVSRYLNSSPQQMKYDFYIDRVVPHIDSYTIENQILRLNISDDTSGLKLVKVFKNKKEIKKSSDNTYNISQDNADNITIFMSDWAGNNIELPLN